MDKIAPIKKKGIGGNQMPFMTSREDNPRILRIKTAKFPGFCLYMNTDIYGDFQIYISVSLKTTPKFSLNLYEKQYIVLLKIPIFLAVLSYRISHCYIKKAGKIAKKTIGQSAFYRHYQKYLKEIFLS